MCDADRAIEREANVFAAEPLMPEEALRVAWAAAREVDDVAARLDVSPSAMGWRLLNLGMITKKPKHA